MARRVVGYLEYGNALDNLDRLVRSASEQELAAIDEIVREHDELTVYSNLSNQLPSGEHSGSPSSTKSTGARRGLAWVIALARVEFGAILAGFTDHPDPYAFVNPRAYDFRESMELLLDGVLSQYSAMEQDEDFREITSLGGPIKNTLAYSRRVRIVQKMLEGAMKPGPSRYSRSQAQKLGSYHKDLDDAQDVLVAQIRQYLAARARHSDVTTTREFREACTIQLQAEKRELAEGTATVRKYPDSGPHGLGGACPSINR